MREERCSKTCCNITTLIVFIISVCACTALFVVANNSKCEDCSNFCDLCDCPGFNTTSSGQQSCSDCSSCLRCDSLTFDMSRDFGIIFLVSAILTPIAWVCFHCK